MMPGVTKIKVLAGPDGSTATNATSATYVDRLGFDHAVVDVIAAAAAATNSSAKWNVLKLLHSDDATNTTGITGASGTTNAVAASGEFVLPAWNDTDDAQVVRFHVDCRSYGRYLHVSATPGATMTEFIVLANLYRSREEPDTTTEANVAAHVFV
jgi:hypothetical protein